MSRSTRAVFLLLALLWQGLFAVTPYGLDLKADKMAHAVVHAEAVNHHHHDDRSLHLDEAADDASHQHVHEGVQPAGLLPSLMLRLAERLPAAPAAVAGFPVPTVFLEGPLRPPQRLT
ncbi:MAG: hypothetical protein AB7S86_11950 [Hydrogenophaga sp.]|uniref:hypothetical protein n=1 Tax=Hydrogenophaga sp. TaxID=1904254 RepID=UPI003D0D7F3C